MIQVTNDTFGNAGRDEVRFADEDDLRLHIHALAVDSGWYAEYRDEARHQFEDLGSGDNPIEGDDYMSLAQFEADLFRRAMKGAEVSD